MSNVTLFNAKAFHEAPERLRSPEWDYGVMWVNDDDDGRRWPLWRVSWVVETGEVYAQHADKVFVIGVVPKDGEYPYTSHEDWFKFNDRQPIEKVMKGWADEPHRPLNWVASRIRQWEAEHAD